MSIVLIIVVTLAAPILAIVFAEWWRARRKRKAEKFPTTNEPKRASEENP